VEITHSAINLVFPVKNLVDHGIFRLVESGKASKNLVFNRQKAAKNLVFSWCLVEYSLGNTFSRITSTALNWYHRWKDQLYIYTSTLRYF